MLHPSTALQTIDATIGLGVVATRAIPRGTIVWARDPLDQAFSPEQMRAFREPVRAQALKFTFVDQRGDSVLCWDMAKFVNHSCEANLLGTPFEFEVAARDIAPGEQLTDDYGSLNLAAPLECRCGAARCRGSIQADDALRLSPSWDALNRDVFPALLRVEQPLWSLLDDPAAVEAAAEDPDSLPSVAVNYASRRGRSRGMASRRPRPSRSRRS